MPSLHDFPNEIVDNIARHLDGRSLGALRLTSHRWYDATFADFAGRIRNIRWHPSVPLLSRLLGISEDRRLASRIRTLRFATTVNVGVGQSLPTGVTVSDEDFSEWERGIFYHIDSHWHCDTMSDIVVDLPFGFRDVIANLDNLEHIEIDDPIEDYHDGQVHLKLWAEECESSSGTVALRFRTVSASEEPSASALHTKDWYTCKVSLMFIFWSLLYGLVDRAKPIKSLVACSRRWKDKDRAKGMPVSDFPALTEKLTTGLREIFKNLKRMKMMLEFENQPDVPSWRSLREDHEIRRQKQERWLAEFVNLAPKLEELDLILDAHYRHIYSYWQDKTECMAFHYFATHASLARLTQLRLRGLNVVYDDIYNLWCKLQNTLTNIHLVNVGLLKGSGGDCWLQLLKEIAKKYEQDLPIHRIDMEFAWLANRVDISQPQGEEIMKTTGFLVFSREGHGGCNTCLLNVDGYRNKRDRYGWDRYELRLCQHLSGRCRWPPGIYASKDSPEKLLDAEIVSMEEFNRLAREKYGIGEYSDPMGVDDMEEATDVDDTGETMDVDDSEGETET
ncbi:hypothetical protein B0T19DRAFT_423991 [Cercophora scortea]|uniref:F-box domain-containing protein n=1 Tax=Cercophora scortea TaxID=314031 RepID=A0AAE0INI8_9PEZI|nr:hypothetical protein B0T19DRAFT_423991 [Cercophora scortea]